MAHISRIHRLQQVHKTADVGLDIIQRFGHRFSHSLFRREMNDSVKIMRSKDTRQKHRIKHITTVQFYWRSSDPRKPERHVFLCIGKIIEDDNIVSGGDQSQVGM